MDKTLIDNQVVDFDEILVQALGMLGLEVPKSERDTLWKSGKEHVHLLSRWGVADQRGFWKIFDDLDFETRDKYIHSGHIALYPDTVDCLDRLREIDQFSLALLTNTPLPLARHQLESFHLQGYFDFILALDMGEYDQLTAKPEPWGVFFILDYFRSETGVDFKETSIFIGDSTIDMMTARNAGIPGIQILRAGRTRLPNAFHVITSLDVVDLEFTRSILHQFHGANNH